MWDEDLLRSLALVQAQVRAIERKKKIFSDLGDMQAFNGLKADLENYVASSVSAGLIPNDPLGNVSNRLNDLVEFFAAAQTIYDEVLQTGAETLSEGVPPVSLERLRDLPNQISAWRQVLSSKVSACQPQINSLDWAGAVGQSDIHQELFHLAIDGKLPKDSASRINLCCFVFGTGPLWDSALDHLNQVEKRVQELIPIHEQHRVAVENANAHGRFGNYRSANQILTEVGIDCLNPDKPCSKFSDILYGEVLTLLDQMHESAKTMDALCSNGITAEAKVLNHNLKKISGSIWPKKSAQAVEKVRVALEGIQNRLAGHKRYVEAFPESELHRDYQSVLAQGDNLLASAHQEFEAIIQKGQKLGKIKRRVSFAGATLLSLFLAALFIHIHLTEKTGVELNVSVAAGNWVDLDVSQDSVDIVGYFWMTIRGGAVHEEIYFSSIFENGSLKLDLHDRWFILPSGEYQLECGMAAFRPFSKKFEVKYGKRANLGTIELIPVHGALEVITDPPGAIVFNSSGQEVGTTPFKKEKEALGQKIFRVSHPHLGYSDLKGEVEDGKRLTLSYRFARAKTLLNSEINDSVVVLAGGKSIPLPWQGELPPGLIFFHAFKAGFIEPRSFHAFLAENKTNRVEVPFLKPGILRFWMNGRVVRSWPNIIGIESFSDADTNLHRSGKKALALRANGDVVALTASKKGELIGSLQANQQIGQIILKGARTIGLTKNAQVALLRDGRVVYWHEAGLAKQLIEIKGLDDVISISCSNERIYGLNKYGHVRGVWTGSGNSKWEVDYSMPNVINGHVVAIAAGGGHTLALLRNGTVAAWGDNSGGQCTVPEGLKNVVSVAAGKSHSMALTVEGKVVAWGDNSRGQTNVPSRLPEAVAIHANPDSYWSFVTIKDGRIATWGIGGQLKEAAKVPLELKDRTVFVEANNDNAMIYSLSVPK